MLRPGVLRVVLPVQVTGAPVHRKARVLHIPQRRQKQVVVVGFKPDLPLLFQQSPVFLQLLRVGQAALVVPRLGPRVAEIDVDPGALLLFGVKKAGELLDIPGKQRDVVHRRLPVGLLDQPAPHAQHIVALVNADKIHLRVPVGGLAQKFALPAPQIEENGLVLFEKGAPLPPHGRRFLHIIRARRQFRAGPFLFAHSHTDSPLCRPFGRARPDYTKNRPALQGAALAKTPACFYNKTVKGPGRS